MELFFISSNPSRCILIVVYLTHYFSLTFCCVIYLNNKYFGPSCDLFLACFVFACCVECSVTIHHHCPKLLLGCIWGRECRAALTEEGFNGSHTAQICDINPAKYLSGVS